MKYTMRRSYVDILGGLWWPYGAPCSLRKSLSGYDLEHMRDDDGHITRDSLHDWILLHSGDFSRIIDFSASIEDGDTTLDFPWTSEATECQYLDTLGEPA